jgi:hypothetical protein
MDELQLGFYIRGKWELAQGNVGAALKAFEVMGNNPLAKVAISDIYATEPRSLDEIISSYIEAAECGALQVLPLVCSLINLYNPHDERLAQFVKTVDAELEADNPQVIGGAFLERLTVGDSLGAARACSEAIRLKDPQSMSKLAEILLHPSGFEEFLYFLADREIFDPKPWPVPVVVTTQDDSASMVAFFRFIDSLCSQGEATRLFGGGVLRVLRETSDPTWAHRMMDLFANRPEDSEAFWSDPELILFYTHNLVSTNMNYEVEWIRQGISKFGLEDIFDRVIELALLSTGREHTESKRILEVTQPHIYLQDREITIYEGFWELVGNDQELRSRLATNPYCRLFDEGKLVDLKSILSQDTELACSGAESLLNHLCDFLVLSNVYAEQGLIELIDPSIRIIHKKHDANGQFTTLLASKWLNFGTRYFAEDSAISLLPSVLMSHPTVPSEIREKIHQYFPREICREELDSAVGTLIQQLENGENVLEKLAIVIQTGLEEGSSGFEQESWIDLDFSVMILNALEKHDDLWDQNLIDLANALSELDDHFICDLIRIDSSREKFLFTDKDLNIFARVEYCSESNCVGARALSKEHPNFK